MRQIPDRILPVEEVTIQKKKYHLDKHYLADPRPFGSCLLFQLGRLWCTEETVVAKHAHINWFELTIVTEGKGIVSTGDAEIPVSLGDIYLSFPCDFHGIVSDAHQPLKYDFFAFGTTDDDLSADLDRIMRTHMPADRRIIRDETISALIRSAISEIERNDRYSEKLLGALFSQVLIRLVRNFSPDSADFSQTKVTEAQTLCLRLMNYIDTHIYTMTGLEELALDTNYNYSYLSALFHKITGGTLADYYRNRRLETARLLLAEQDLSITNIADLLHYSSIYTFSRAFKDKYGISPAQYRTRQK